MLTSTTHHNPPSGRTVVSDSNDSNDGNENENHEEEEQEQESKSEAWNFAGFSSSEGDNVLMTSYLEHDIHHSPSSEYQLQQEHQGQGGRGGLLIVDGESSSSYTHQDHLSYPGSVPTEIDAIIMNEHQHDSDGDVDGNSQSFHHSESTKNMYNLNRRSNKNMKTVMMMMLANGMVMALLIFVTAFLYWNRIHLLRDQQAAADRNSLLENQVKELQHQLFLMQQQQTLAAASARQRALSDKNDWENDDEKLKLQLANNCWFKAELELGECFVTAKESLEEFLTMDSTRSWTDFFFKTTDDDDDKNINSIHDNNSNNSNSKGVMVQQASLMPTAILPTTTSLLESMASWSNSLDDTVLRAVEQSRDAIRDATHFLRDL